MSCCNTQSRIARRFQLMIPVYTALRPARTSSQQTRVLAQRRRSFPVDMQSRHCPRIRSARITVVVFRDITERKRSNNLRLASIVESTTLFSLESLEVLSSGWMPRHGGSAVFCLRGPWFIPFPCLCRKTGWRDRPPLRADSSWSEG